MEIERRRLEQILRQRGSNGTADTVERHLPEQIDTQRDRQLIEECGIDPNVLETIARRAMSS